MASRQFTTTSVPTIPACDFCGVDAYADARVPGAGWANLCKPHFDSFGCSLGLGRGQTFVLAPMLTLPSIAFDQWLDLLDVELSRRCGMSTDDLPDRDYAALWSDGISPRDTAERIVAGLDEEAWS